MFQCHKNTVYVCIKITSLGTLYNIHYTVHVVFTNIKQKNNK